jgi:hypothetical protein
MGPHRRLRRSGKGKVGVSKRAEIAVQSRALVKSTRIGRSEQVQLSKATKHQDNEFQLPVNRILPIGSRAVFLRRNLLFPKDQQCGFFCTLASICPQDWDITEGDCDHRSRKQRLHKRFRYGWFQSPVTILDSW